MSYAGSNRGGTAAILAAESLARDRVEAAGALPAGLAQTAERFRHSIDRIMGEGGLWDEETATAAFVQAAGDPAEAVHLLRAHRSTLPRFAVSEPIDLDGLSILRRVVPAERDPQGPQLLGETMDYTPRLLGAPLAEEQDGVDRAIDPAGHSRRPPRYSRALRERGLLADRAGGPDADPFDPSTQAPQFPAPRSAVLAALALAETGGLVGLWYQSILGPEGYADENVTLGDVRYGRVAVAVLHPHTGLPVSIGEIRVTDAEAIVGLDEREEDGSFDLGFGMAFGFNERKAIAMADLDIAAHRFRGDERGGRLQQLILLALDGLASNGFLEHLKLPHYVTFQSSVERALARRQA